MPIIETLAPLVLLIALGAGLAHIKFLGREFMSDLNKLAFWIALPALLFTSASHAGESGGQTGLLFGVLLVGTVLITLIAWGVSFPLRMPASGRGTIMQSAFRGNQGYIGVPVLAYSLGADKKAFATAVIVMVLLMAFYNVFAVMVLHPGSLHGSDWKRALRSIATNPLLLAGLLGLALPFAGITLPAFVNRALDALGAAAVPIALLCIGGSLAITSMRGRRSWIVAAALLKVAVLPFLVFALGRLAGLGAQEMRIALVMAASPTAAAAFVMAKQMGGDEALASGSIALSTILSALSLGTALWVTS
ncbi:MAG: AEC family transporter [Terrimicrobiaceae bacterium]